MKNHNDDKSDSNNKQIPTVFKIESIIQYRSGYHVIIHKAKIQENIWKKKFGMIHILNTTRMDEVEDNIMTTKRLICHDFPSNDL
jgi:recombinational DNA repair protein RecR